MRFLSNPFGRKQPTDHSELAQQMISASRAGKFDEVRALIDNQLLTSLPSDSRANVLAVGLFEAASMGHLDIVRELAWAGANLDRPYPVGGETALTIAAFTGRSEVVQFLAAYGANVNMRNSSGITPLMLAAAKCDRITVQGLIKTGANVRATAPNGLTAKTFAEFEGRNDVAELLESLTNT